MFSNVTLYTAQTCDKLVFNPSKTYILMVAQAFELSSLSLDETTASVYSIVVPSVIWKTDIYQDAFLCCEIKPHNTLLFCQKEKDVSTHLLEKSKSVMVFVDWLDSKIYRYLDKLFSLTCEDVTIMGMGCGRVEGIEQPILARNGYELKNGFLMIASSNNTHVGTGHGSKYHDGYFIAHTENSNKIVSINGESAFDFYATMLKKHFNETLSEHNIFDLGLKYPFGIGSTQQEYPLRVPVSVENGALIVAGPMEEGSTLCLMKSEEHNFFKASLHAVDEAMSGVDGIEEKDCFLIECMGREHVLKAEFQQEINAIAYEASKSKRVYGVLCLGEIANSARQYIEYFNESCVIGVI